jgi:capsular polysaccharide biosynthesis protein
MPYNYYHWMMEAVPRLGAYAEAGMEIDRIYAPIGRKFQRETLRLLGIPRGQVVRGTRHSHVRCERVLASSCNTPTTRRKTAFLHNAMTSHLDGRVPPGLRVYVSRRRRGKRIITNDTEVFQSLAPLGFQRYDLETMSVADQVALFYGAECVVASHGAGLTNILFCRAGTKVIEVNTPYRTSTCFYDIAHHRGLAYRLHIAEPVHKGFFHFDSSTGLGDSNMSVEPGPFAALVRSFLDDASAADHTDCFRRAVAA